LSDRRIYYTRHKRFLWSWTVPVYVDMSDGNKIREQFTEEPIDRRFDGMWRRHIESSTYQWNEIVQAAGSCFSDDTWTPYPGGEGEGGKWEFQFHGRSGKHLCLADWSWGRLPDDKHEAPDWLAELEDDWFFVFARGILSLDHETRREAVEQECLYQAGFARARFEEEQLEELRQRRIARRELAGRRQAIIDRKVKQALEEAHA
jgi:hypothetical protein